MARIFATSIDLSRNELQNAVMHPLASDPGSPADGQVWFNSTSGILKYYDGTAVVELTEGGGLANVIEDITPQLGGELDLNGNSIYDATQVELAAGGGPDSLIWDGIDLKIGVNPAKVYGNAGTSGYLELSSTTSSLTSLANGDIDITPHGTGNVMLGTLPFDADQTVGAGEDDYALIYDHSSGLITLSPVAGGGAFSVDGNTQITPSTSIVLDQATGNEIALDLSYTANKATSGNATGLYMSITDTGSPGELNFFHFENGGGTVARLDSTDSTLRNNVGKVIDFENMTLGYGSGSPEIDLSGTDIKFVDGGGSIFLSSSGLSTLTGFLGSRVDVSASYLNDSGGSLSVDWGMRYLSDGTQTSVDWSSRYLYNSSGTVTVDWTGILYNSSNGSTSVDWTGRVLHDGMAISLDWSNRILADSNGDPLLSFGGAGLVDVSGNVLVDTVLLKDSAGELQLRNAGDTLYADLRVKNLVVEGTTTTVNSETVEIADNVILLNSNEAGAPSENAGLEVERGTSANAQVLWNETSDRWQFNDGTTTWDISRKYAETIGDAAATQITVTHNLNTEDIDGVVCRYAAGTKQEVVVDWRVTGVNTIRIDFATAPALNEFRVVVTG